MTVRKICILFYSKNGQNFLVDLLYLFTKKAKRGGMSFIGHRYADANNKYLESFDPTKESSDLMYFDTNSLYS